MTTPTLTPKVLNSLAEGKYAFIDAGSGTGGSIAYCTDRFACSPGLGLELVDADAEQARASGWDVVTCDLRGVEFPRDSVSYASMMDVLEHLPTEEDAVRVLEALAVAARDFLFIRHPSFEDIAYLAHFGLKVTWTDWSEHPNMMRIADYRRIFANLGWNDYVITPRYPILDSWHYAILPESGPRDVEEYDPEAHGPKPYVTFDRPMYEQFDILVRLNPDLDEDAWRQIVAESETARSTAVGDGVGVYLPERGLWFIQNPEGQGHATFSYGPGGEGWMPIVGDWTGSGRSGPGVYNPADGTFFLKSELTDGDADETFTFAKAGGLPIVGDWEGEGRDSVGVYFPESHSWFLRMSDGSAVNFSFGSEGAEMLPVAGDWNGDGRDSVGLYDPVNGSWHLLAVPETGADVTTFDIGFAGGMPVAGDWDGDGVDGVGIYVPKQSRWHLRNDPSSGEPDRGFTFGPPGNVGLAGRWA